MASAVWTRLAGRLGSRNLGGPVAVSQTTVRVAEYDWFLFINFLGLISLNFCWVNLLPVPILDGGEVMLLAIETSKGRALASRTRRIACCVGAALMSAWMLCGVAVEL